MCNFQTRRLKRLEEKGVNIAEVKNAMDYEKQQYKFVQSLFKVEPGEISFRTFISLLNCDLEHMRGF